MQKVYVTGCTHFGHANIIGFSNRPFINVQAMNEHLINKWNETVNDDDIVIHLGDFCWGKPQEYLPRLKGRKHLIIGNHDKEVIDHPAWMGVRHYAEMNHNGNKLVLCHYPIESWNGMMRPNVYHLHAHTHGRLQSYKQRIDASVDGFGGTLNDFGPVNVDDLIKHAQLLPDYTPTEIRPRP